MDHDEEEEAPNFTVRELENVLPKKVLEHLEPVPGGEWRILRRGANEFKVVYYMGTNNGLMTLAAHDLTSVITPSEVYDNFPIHRARSLDSANTQAILPHAQHLLHQPSTQDQTQTQGHGNGRPQQLPPDPQELAAATEVARAANVFHLPDVTDEASNKSIYNHAMSMVSMDNIGQLSAFLANPYGSPGHGNNSPSQSHNSTGNYQSSLHVTEDIRNEASLSSQQIDIDNRIRDNIGPRSASWEGPNEHAIGIVNLPTNESVQVQGNQQVNQAMVDGFGDDQSFFHDLQGYMNNEQMLLNDQLRSNAQAVSSHDPLHGLTTEIQPQSNDAITSMQDSCVSQNNGDE